MGKQSTTVCRVPCWGSVYGTRQRADAGSAASARPSSDMHKSVARFAGVREFADVRSGRSAPGAHICQASGFPVGSDTLQQGVMTETLWDVESGLNSPNETQ